MLIGIAFVAAAAFVAAPSEIDRHVVRFVFTSDAHYGLTRASFRGRRGVSAHDVNTALVSDINALTDVAGPIDFVVEGGDVANRAEVDEQVQPASLSWSQFKSDYLGQLTLRTAAGTATPIYVVPGNHDASNAIGFYKPMRPAIDATPMVEIYNLARGERSHA